MIKMPKEGFSSVTIPEELEDKISEFVEENKGVVNNKAQAISQAWQIYSGLFNNYKNPRPVRIGSKLVGHSHPVFVVAEVGINHNGDMRVAKELIDLAVETGCDAVKFQKKNLETHYPRESIKTSREILEEKTNLNEQGLEFREAEYAEIDRYCREKNILWFACPEDLASIDFLEKFNITLYGVSSAMLTNSKFLQKIKESGKPIIVYASGSTMEEIFFAMKILGNERAILLYRAPANISKEEELNINVIKTFRKYFNCPIGFGCHTPEIWSSIVAVSSSACFIEKPITLERSMFGWNHAASIEPLQLREMVRILKKIPGMLGSHDLPE